MTVRPVLDVSSLEHAVFGARTPLWWGMMCLICIESTAFALGIASYFYLRMRFTSWPPVDAGPPDLAVPLINTVVILGAAFAQWRADMIVRDTVERRPLLRWLLAGLLLMIVATVLRIWDFRALNCDWTEHSYGSITWALLGMHTIHVWTSVIEGALCVALAWRAKLDHRHRLDIHVNSVYTYFLAASWVVVFLVIWGAGRAL